MTMRDGLRWSGCAMRTGVVVLEIVRATAGGFIMDVHGLRGIPPLSRILWPGGFPGARRFGEPNGGDGSATEFASSFSKSRRRRAGPGVGWRSIRKLPAARRALRKRVLHQHSLRTRTKRG